MANHCAQTTMISIVPEDIISVAVGVTPALREKWGEYIDVIVVELIKRGIRCTKKENLMSLDEILEQFANPSIEHGKGF
jgi:hydrogenase maturation protease